MARELLNHVEAIRSLLAGLHGTGSYNDVAALRKNQLLQMLSTVSFTAGDAGLLVASLRTIDWPSGMLDPLLIAVNAASCSERNPRGAGMQDFASIHNHYPQAVWIPVVTCRISSSES